MSRLHRVPGTESTRQGPQEGQTKKVSLPAQKGLFEVWDDSSVMMAARDGTHDISTKAARHEKAPHSAHSSKRRSLFLDISDQHNFLIVVSIVGPFLAFVLHGGDIIFVLPRIHSQIGGTLITCSTLDWLLSAQLTISRYIHFRSLFCTHIIFHFRSLSCTHSCSYLFVPSLLPFQSSSLILTANWSRESKRSKSFHLIQTPIKYKY
ncbi:hypothetical protein ACMFMG_012209 [Clarireedia jacksonii]